MKETDSLFTYIYVSLIFAFYIINHYYSIGASLLCTSFLLLIIILFTAIKKYSILWLLIPLFLCSLSSTIVSSGTRLYFYYQTLN